MLTLLQETVLLGYAAIIGGEYHIVRHDDIEVTFTTRGNRSWYTVGCVSDWLSYPDRGWEATGRGATLEEAYEKCLENARNHHRYLDWMESIHESVNALPIVSQEMLTSDGFEDTDVFVPAQVKSKVSGTWFFEEARYHGPQARKFGKRYHNRFMRREARSQLQG